MVQSLAEAERGRQAAPMHATMKSAAMMRADDETISPIDENIRKMVLDAAVLGLENFSALVLVFA